MVDQALALKSYKISTEPEDFQSGGESYGEATLRRKDLSLTCADNVFCSQGTNVSSLNLIYQLGFLTKQNCCLPHPEEMGIASQ